MQLLLQIQKSQVPTRGAARREGLLCLKNRGSALCVSEVVPCTPNVSAENTSIHTRVCCEHTHVSTHVRPLQTPLKPRPVPVLLSFLLNFLTLFSHSFALLYPFLISHLAHPSSSPPKHHHLLLFLPPPSPLSASSSSPVSALICRLSLSRLLI